MNRANLPVGIGLVAAALVVAACGSAATAGVVATSPSPSAGAGFRGGASGQLVQINPQTLILTGPNGDVTVTYSSATTVTKTSLAALADIAVGMCVNATGQKNASGAIVATTVTVSPGTANGCPVRAIPTPSPGASPRPSPSFSPPPGFANRAFASGQVTAVSGTSMTVHTVASGDVTVVVPSTATVTRSAVVNLAALQTGQCLSAIGPKDSSGNVQANALTIT
ncbi:MAG: DUF5666 domain-containing protein, partial [Candidatus Dormibacterales bacterium]